MIYEHEIVIGISKNYAIHVPITEKVCMCRLRKREREKHSSNII